MNISRLLPAAALVLLALALGWFTLRPDPLEQAALAFGLPAGADASGEPEETAADGAMLRSLTVPFTTPPGRYTELPDLITVIGQRCAELGHAPEPGRTDDWPVLLCRLDGEVLLGGRGTCTDEGCRAALIFSQS
ncbi:hypothetical protein FHY55_13460 [Oceanicola sp. D3]|uniref:hypothetical protein n=1 Tax=Oceanicola sp. D3 TaxID=2587163 RepID=UPI001120ED90|nr:hypothetical protein [Oceanicola sp. D3]QDC10193.1 hypothetical protein FHY55_13460 [Oceanicola sp. D3]